MTVADMIVQRRRQQLSCLFAGLLLVDCSQFFCIIIIINLQRFTHVGDDTKLLRAEATNEPTPAMTIYQNERRLGGEGVEQSSPRIVAKFSKTANLFALQPCYSNPFRTRRFYCFLEHKQHQETHVAYQLN